MIKRYTSPNGLLALDPMLERTAFDFSALESFEEFRALTEEATLIVAVDKNGGGLSPVFGLEVVRAIAQGVIPSQNVNLVTFMINFQSDQLEQLLAMVYVVKGFYEYNGGSTDSGPPPMADVA